MAANSGGSDSTGRKNYYNIAYGMLCTNAKTAPDGYEEMPLASIKSKREKKENVDLRKKFYDTKNGKDFPLKVFYTDIDGIIDSLEKEKYSKGTALKVTLHDSDGDESVIQTDFYGKVSENLLNRLVNVQPNTEVNFRPYSIPSEYTPEGGEMIKYYNSGVSIKFEGEKIGPAYKPESGLPDTERIENSQGVMETSRVKRINFLWEKVENKFSESSPAAPVEKSAPKVQSKPAEQATSIPHDDLPF